MRRTSQQVIVSTRESACSDLPRVHNSVLKAVTVGTDQTDRANRIFTTTLCLVLRLASRQDSSRWCDATSTRTAACV